MDELHDTDMFKQRLAEVIGWCSIHASTHDPQNSLRTPELQPRQWAKYGEQEFAGLDAQQTLRERAEIVDELCAKRVSLLKEKCIQPVVASSPLGGGQLLLYIPDETLSDCGAAEETNGFFDCDDTPPWDTWLWFVGTEERTAYSVRQWYTSPSLVTWIPSEFIELTNSGISVCLGDTLRWASDVDSPFTRQLKLAGLL